MVPFDFHLQVSQFIHEYPLNSPRLVGYPMPRDAAHDETVPRTCRPTLNVRNNSLYGQKGLNVQSHLSVFLMAIERLYHSRKADFGMRRGTLCVSYDNYSHLLTSASATVANPT